VIVLAAIAAVTVLATVAGERYKAIHKSIYIASGFKLNVLSRARPWHIENLATSYNPFSP